jgi:hypothetical protein
MAPVLSQWSFSVSYLTNGQDYDMVPSLNSFTKREVTTKASTNAATGDGGSIRGSVTGVGTGDSRGK